MQVVLNDKLKEYMEEKGKKDIVVSLVACNT